jgi:hypothetical protein
MSVQTDSSVLEPSFLRDLVHYARVDADAEPETSGSQPGTSVEWVPCEICGKEARLLILEGYAQRQPVVRRFCLTCSASAEAGPARERTRLSLHVLVGLASLVSCVVGLFGDHLVPSAHPGFGWHQELGVVAGGLLLLVGLILRADVVALGGGFLLAASLCADWFGWTRGPGIGWKQQLMILIGAVGLLLAAAFRMRRRWGDLRAVGCHTAD